MNIIISGLTCSGKTTLSNELLKASILREDDYMKDRINIPNNGKYYLMDLPSAYNIDEYVKDAKSLIANGHTYYPQYDFKRNMRVNKDNKLSKGKINVFEGLHTIDALKDLENSLKVFMDIDIDTCLQRRINRDTKLYGIDPKMIRQYFNEVILPIYRRYIEYQRDISDVVIRGEEDKECLKKRLEIYY